MTRRKPRQLKFEAMWYDGKEIQSKVMSRREVEAIDPKKYDHYRAHCFGILAFRTASGEWIEYRNGNWPGIGREGLKLLEASQLEPGIYRTCGDLAEVTGNDNFDDANCVSALVLRLRLAHRESKGKQWFFFTPDSGEMAVCWPKDRSWMILEAVRGKEGQEDEMARQSPSK